MCLDNTATSVCGSLPGEVPAICDWSTIMLLMGLASNHFSPDDDKNNDHNAWHGALYPPRLYEAVVAEAAGGVQHRPIWDALRNEIRDLLNWAVRAQSLQGGDRLLYQTPDLQWHWNQRAASEYEVMHAWAVEGGLVEPDSEPAGVDGGPGNNDGNAGGGGGGGGGGAAGGRDGGDGGNRGEEVIGELTYALTEAAQACNTGREDRLSYALVLVEGPRQRMRDDMWHRRR